MNSEQDIGIIFDMDGVLVDSAEPHFQSWRVLATERGVCVSRDQFDQTFGRQNRDIIPIVFGVTSENDIKIMADRKETIYRDLISGKAPIVDGAIALMTGLHLAGARLAIGSSAPRENVDLVLREMGVTSLVSASVSGDEVERGKPDPQVFQIAIKRLGLAAKCCAVIEDAPAGIEAALAAGASAIAILMHHQSESFPHARLVANRLSDLTPDGIIDTVRNRLNCE